MTTTGDTLTAAERALCAAQAAWLHAGRVLSAIGLGLSALALIALLPGMRGGPFGAAQMAFTAVALLGAVERYLALRLRLDERLFEALADARLPSLHALDDGLRQLGLRARSAEPRPLAQRLDGTRRLVRQHAAVVALQCLGFAGALAVA